MGSKVLTRTVWLDALNYLGLQGLLDVVEATLSGIEGSIETVETNLSEAIGANLEKVLVNQFVERGKYTHFKEHKDPEIAEMYRVLGAKAALLETAAEDPNREPVEIPPEEGKTEGTVESTTD